MKTLTKIILVFVISVSTFAQIDTLQRIETRSIEFSIASLPSNQGDTLFVVNYFQLGQIYTVYSLDEGKTWEYPGSGNIYAKVVGRHGLSSLRIPDRYQRIFIAWIDSTGGIGVAKTSISSNFNFSDKFIFPEIEAATINLSRNQNKSNFIAVGTNSGRVELYSLNDSFTSLNHISTIDSLNGFAPEVSLVHLAEDVMLAIYPYESPQGYKKIYYRKSIDNGKTWSERRIISNYLNRDHENMQAIRKSNGEIYVVFEVNSDTKYYNEYTGENFKNRDIYFYKSNDDGLTWTSEQLTSFILTDNFWDIYETNNEVKSIINTSRFSSYDYLTYYYICSVEQYNDPSPPAILSFTLQKFENSYIANAHVIDNVDIPRGGLDKVFVTINNTDTTWLHDKGLTHDGQSGDDIWGNVLPQVSDDIPRTQEVIKVNNITMPFSNRGLLADVGVSDVDAKVTLVAADKNGNIGTSTRTAYGSGNQYFNASYDDITFLYSAGFSLSGKNTSGEIWANVVHYSDYMEDYYPGPVGSNPNDPLNQIYVVKRSDPPFGSSWQYWSDAVKIGANFYDGDGDGIYEPVDKNNNGVWDPNEDKPDLLYDETFFTTFNDAKPKDQRPYGIRPLSIEIRQTIFASSQNSILDDVIFIRYSIVNKGQELNEVYFSLYDDADLGDYRDDSFGSDTTLNSGFYYNWEPDEEYGDNPPAFFTAIVQGPVVESPGDVATINYGPDLGQKFIPDHKNLGMNAATMAVRATILPDPRNAKHMYYYAQGKLGDGSYPDPCNFGYGNVFNMSCFYIDRKYWLSGDPVTHNGWLCIPTSDVRGFTSTGPFTLSTDEPVDIIVAYVVTRGTNSLNSITKAREITQYVHEEYQRNFSTIVGVDANDEEVVNRFSLSQNYPNPFNPTSKIKYQIAKLGKVELKVYDILGREVTTLVNEVKSPGIYEITFDGSQIASGVYFYRLTSGDYVQTKKMMLIK